MKGCILKGWKKGFVVLIHIHYIHFTKKISSTYNKNKGGLMVMFILLGCWIPSSAIFKGGTTSDTGGTNNSNNDSTEVWSFSPYWTDDCTLRVEITGGTGSYYLGLAETADAQGWYGEDCSLNGICHPINASLTLDSVHPDCGGDISQVAAGSTTLFKSSLEGRITYAVFDMDYNLVDCSGDDCSYF